MVNCFHQRRSLDGVIIHTRSVAGKGSVMGSSPISVRSAPTV